MEVIYSKYNRLRLPQFQIETTIFTESGQKKVGKKALTPDGINHIAKIYQGYSLLAESISYHRVKSPRVLEKKDSQIVLEFISGESFDKILFKAFLDKKKDKFLDLIKDYHYLLNHSFKTVNRFILTPGVPPIFHDVDMDLIEKEKRFFSNSLLDIILENIIIAGNDYYIIDNEWIWDSCIPVPFVFFRGLYIFYKYKYPDFGLEAFISFLELLGQFNFSMDLIKQYSKIEENFQAFVHGENLTNKSRYLKVNRPVNEILDFDSQYSTPNYEAQLFIDTGLGFNENQSIRKPLTGEEKKIIFDLSGYQYLEQIRFDPLNDKAALHISGINIFTINRRTYKILKYRSNACFKENNNLIFATNDPQIYLDIKRKIKAPQTLIIQLEYISIGPDTNRYLSKLKDVEISTKEAKPQKKDLKIEALNKEISSKESELQEKDIIIVDLNKEINRREAELQKKGSRIEALIREINTKEARLHEKDSSIEALNKEISSKDMELQKRDSRIETLNKAVSEKDMELQKRDSTIETLRKEIRTQEAELHEKYSRIETLNQEISSKETELQERYLIIADLNKEIRGKGVELQKEDSIIETLNKEKMQQLIKLESLQGQLETERFLKKSILNSKSWKLTAPLRWIYNKVKK